MFLESMRGDIELLRRISYSVPLGEVTDSVSVSLVVKEEEPLLEPWSEHHCNVIVSLIGLHPLRRSQVRSGLEPQPPFSQQFRSRSQCGRVLLSTTNTIT